METKTLIDRSLTAFLRDFQEHIQLGWEIDENNPPHIWGVCYETGLVRSDKSIAALATRNPKQPVKTKAEILMHARQVRADKRQAAQQEGATL